MAATTTDTSSLDARIAARLAELTKARSERLDPLDYPRVWTQRQVQTYEAETTKIDAKIAALRTAVETLAAMPTLDADTRWRDFLTWRAPR